jgi:ABC-2 type transport system ATP-binding protein
MPAVQMVAVSKTYRRRSGPPQKALDRLDLLVENGGVHGFLGPNGSGKTTTIRVLLGLVRADGGESRLLDRPVPEALPEVIGHVGALVETPLFFPGFSGRLNLQLLADVAGVSKARVDECLELVDLTERADDRFKGYSLGMKQRLGIAAALLRDPKLLMLDEPATGLDPAGMRDMRRLIRRMAQQGMTVLLSSHLLAEVEELCNRVAIVRGGRIVYEGEIAQLKRSAGTTYRLRTTDDERALAICRAHEGVSAVRVERRQVAFTAEEEVAAGLSEALVRSGVLIIAMAPESVTLEDLFFSLTEGAEPAPAERQDAPLAGSPR